MASFDLPDRDVIARSAFAAGGGHEEESSAPPITTNAIDAELERSALQFRSPILFDRYRAERDADRRVELRRLVWAAGLVYVMFGALDAYLLPDVAFWTIASRAAFCVLSTLALEVAFHRGLSARSLEVVGAVIVVLCYVGWLLPAMTSQYTAAVSYYMIYGTIFMMVASLFFNLEPTCSNAAASLIVLTFVTASVQFLPLSPTYVAVFGVFYLACFAFTAFVNWKLSEERYRVFLNDLKARIRTAEADMRSKELLHMSMTDPLTSVGNRRAVNDFLICLWDRWRRSGSAFTVFLIDVDFFKKYNDSYGHLAGDRCLATIAGTLSEMTERYGGVLGRYGGEEFLLALPAVSPEATLTRGEEFRAAIRDLAIRHSERRDGETVLTVSVGIAVTRASSSQTLERLINEADRALYRAKASGRNCVRLFDPGDPQSSDETENVAALLRIALDENLVSMVYQPIVGTQSGEIAATEALMRLRMLDGTMVPPSIFIPIAENTGAIHELGLWAVRRACTDILLQDAAPVASMNISAVQLNAPGFAAAIAEIIGELGVEPQRMAFEITEGLDISAESHVLTNIQALRRLGAKIWLDDFGTGFAGLSWLRLVDFDTVKIDKSFLHHCVDERGMTLLRDIFSLVRHRGHRIIVEGVETEEQLDLMRRMRADQVQGYHIGMPAPALAGRRASGSPARA